MGKKAIHLSNLEIVTVILTNFTSQLGSSKEMGGSQSWLFIGIPGDL